MRHRIVSAAYAEYIVGLQSLKWWSEADAATYLRIGPRQFRQLVERTRMRFKATPEGRLFKRDEVDRAVASERR